MASPMYHAVARRFPDRLEVDIVDDATPPPETSEHDFTIGCFIPQIDTQFQIVVHWIPAQPAPNALERATASEAINHQIAAILLQHGAESVAVADIIHAGDEDGTTNNESETRTDEPGHGAESETGA